MAYGSLSRVRLFATLWTVAFQAPLSMGFPRQESWSGLSFPPPGDLSDPGIKPKSSALAGGFLPTEPPGKTIFKLTLVYRPNSALYAEILDSNVLTLCMWTNIKKATCTSPAHNPSFCPPCTISTLCNALIFFPSLILPVICGSYEDTCFI